MHNIQKIVQIHIESVLQHDIMYLLSGFEKSRTAHLFAVFSKSARIHTY